MVDPCTYSYIGSGAWCSLNDNRAKSSPIYRPIFSKGNKNISVRLALWARTDLRNVLPGETGFCGLHKSNISAQCITRLLSPQGPCAIVKQIPLKKMTKKKKKMCTVFTFFSIQEYEKRYLNPFFYTSGKKSRISSYNISSHWTNTVLRATCSPKRFCTGDVQSRITHTLCCMQTFNVFP